MSRCKLLYIVFLLMFFVGCSTNNKKDLVKDSVVEIVERCIDDKKAFENEYISIDFSLKNISTEKDWNSLSGFVFMLNANCSFCISNFLDFMYLLKEKEMSVLVIVDEGTESIIKYHLKQVGLADNKKLIILENIKNKYVEGKMELYSGIVFCYENGSLYKKLLYEGSL